MPPVVGYTALTVARVLGAAYLVTMMFGTGLRLGVEPKADKATKRQRRQLLLRALAIDLLLLPLFAVAVTRALHTAGDVAIALLLLAAAPGGRYAPQLTRWARGDLGLTVEITLFLVKLTPFTAPFVAARLLDVHHIEMHDLPFILQLLLLQLVPYLAGKAVRRHRPALAEWLRRPVELAAVTFAVALFFSLVAHRELRSVFLLGGWGWLATLAFGFLALATGWLLGGPTPRTRRAFAITANGHDLALALVLAGLAFPGRAVQLATFGVWLILFACNAIFAVVAGRRALASAGAVPTSPIVEPSGGG